MEHLLQFCYMHKGEQKGSGSLAVLENTVKECIYPSITYVIYDMFVHRKKNIYFFNTVIMTNLFLKPDQCFLGLEALWCPNEGKWKLSINVEPVLQESFVDHGKWQMLDSKELAPLWGAAKPLLSVHEAFIKCLLLLTHS